MPLHEHLLGVSLPFLMEGTVMYIRNDTMPAIDSFIKRESERIAARMSHCSHTFLPSIDIIDDLSPEMLQYLFPGSGPRAGESFMQIVQRLCFDISSHTGFVRKHYGRIMFCDVSGYDQTKGPEALIEEYIALIRAHRNEPSAEHIRYSAIRASVQNEEEDGRCYSYPSESSIYPEPEPEAPLDTRAQAILRELERIQSRYGISIEELDVILGYRVKLSHLHISTSGRITLTDFDNVEVKMDDLSKAVFFLYLRHPEGISYYELEDHRKELMSLYMRITGKDDKASIQRSIDSLVDRYNNSINVKVSRVKAAFKSVMTDRVAKFYYIDGPQGGTKKIPVDRDLVIWEH